MVIFRRGRLGQNVSGFSRETEPMGFYIMIRGDLIHGSKIKARRVLSEGSEGESVPCRSLDFWEKPAILGVP